MKHCRCCTVRYQAAVLTKSTRNSEGREMSHTPSEKALKYSRHYNFEQCLLVFNTKTEADCHYFQPSTLACFARQRSVT